MPPRKNRRQPSLLTEVDVGAALSRMRRRDSEQASRASEIIDVLTAGEGPEQLRQSDLQEWLWYRLPTRYAIDEGDLGLGDYVEAAAVLFDELGLDAYAEVCRSETTTTVHAAFARSHTEGIAAMCKARSASGLDAPDLPDFAWGSIMGMEEALARVAVEDALEAAIHTDELVIGGRSWRTRQKEIASAALDAPNADSLGQSRRALVITERIGEWVASGTRRSETIGRRRAKLANRLLHPLAPATDLAQHMKPITMLLELIGEKQALTQTGNLTRAFVVRAHEELDLGDDRFPGIGPPRSENEAFELHRLRKWLERVGALRKRNKWLVRTERGGVMATDPQAAWGTLVASIAPDHWAGFVVNEAAEILLDARKPVLCEDLFAEMAADATAMGWRTVGADREAPTRDIDISHGFHELWPLLELCGFAASTGSWLMRTSAIPPAGESTMLAILRATAAGPRSRPY